jgi:internalin A
MSDLNILKTIEKTIGEALTLCELDAVMSSNCRCGYAVDSQQQIIGLNLQNCKQTDLSLIKNLSNLTRLNLSLNQISQLNSLKYLTRLTQLNLQKNNITDLHPLKELGELTQLNLQDNQIVEIKSLRELKNLTLLNLQANQISELKSLAVLTELQNLNLSSNLIKDITPLQTLNNLKTLNLSSNQIADIEPLGVLISLEELDLRFNQIIQTDALQNLKALTCLYLSSNRINNLSSLTNLTALTHLYLSSNDISDISALKHLTNLTELDLRNNHIHQIDAVATLKKLNWLYLENNQIADLMPVEHLTELMQLNLRNNQIISIEPLKNLIKLTQLYLSNNKIQLLPRWLIDFNLKIKWNSGGDGISVMANPLKYPPPEIIRQGNSAIKNYFSGLEQQQQRAVNEIKLCFIGDNGVGKTALIQALAGKNFTESLSPEGISVMSFSYQHITLNCWDFGNAEQIRPLQSLFFSKDSVYVLVLDNRTQRNESYWLRKIQYLAGNAAILVVLNKCEQQEGYDVNRKELLKNYHNLRITDFFYISCRLGLGLNEFKEALINTAKEMPVLKKLWAENWIQLKNSVTAQLAEKHYLSEMAYLQLCEKHGIEDKIIQEQCLEWLHNMGVCVHFKQNHSAETYILAPNWICSTFSKLFLSAQIGENNAVLILKDLPVVLKPESDTDYCYSAENYKDLLNLMLQLELCFLMDKTHILIPQLLPNQEIAADFSTDSLRFKIYYEFLDESILPRLIVSLHDDIAAPEYYRDAVLLNNPAYNTQALVKVDYVQRLIIIQLKGEKERDYFAFIRKVLRTIEATLHT